MPKPLTTEYLRSIFSYDSSDGVIRWMVTRNGYRGGVRPGFVAGHPAPSGYVLLGIDGALYRAHRIAWQMFYGDEPKGLLDHVNGNRCDNRIENLRLSSISRNAQNVRVPHRDNSTGYLGVERFGKTKFQARICVGGVRHKVGVFETAEQAHAAYIEAKRKLHPDGTL